MSVRIPSSSKLQLNQFGKAKIFPQYIPPISTLVATGGTVADLEIGDYTYRIHTFTGSQIFNVTTPGYAEFFIVAGGGGGGSYRSSFSGSPGPVIIHQTGGGGGAGGISSGTATFAISQYDIIIGNGGLGGTWPSIAREANSGQVGNPSKIAFFPEGASVAEAMGGGGGGHGSSAGGSGGSGGGGGSTDSPYNWPTGRATIISPLPGGTGIPNQGYPGGAGAPANHPEPSTNYSQVGGGGGGGGSAGNILSQGGLGKSALITGSEVAYGLGGSGASTDGGQNTGNGGGGGGVNSNGGNGGSGVIVIRYRIP